MGLKRYVKKAKRIALNTNPLIKAVTGGVSNSGDGGDGARAEAAKRTIGRRHQAGGGQINYNSEVYQGDPDFEKGTEIPVTKPTATPAAPSIPKTPTATAAGSLQDSLKDKAGAYYQNAKGTASKLGMASQFQSVTDALKSRAEAAKRLFKGTA